MRVSCLPGFFQWVFVSSDSRLPKSQKKEELFYRNPPVEMYAMIIRDMMGVSKNRGGPPKSSHFNRVFH